jgi:hypothetical protein
MALKSFFRQTSFLFSLEFFNIRTLSTWLLPIYRVVTRGVYYKYSIEILSYIDFHSYSIFSSRYSSKVGFAVNLKQFWGVLPQLNSSCCSPTGMFTLPNPVSHVSSAAFAQALLRLGSGQAHLRLKSAQVCSGLLRSAHPYYATRRS